MIKALQEGRDVVLWPDADCKSKEVDGKLDLSSPGVQAMHWLAYRLGVHDGNAALLVEVIPWLADGWDLADEPRNGFDIHDALSRAWAPAVWDEDHLLDCGKIFRPWDKRYKGPFEGPMGQGRMIGHEERRRKVLA